VPTKSKMSNGETLYIRLVYAVDTDIVRFTKIRSKANPFDECDSLYFEERETVKMRNSIKGRKILDGIFRRQKGLCPVCGQRITTDTGFTVLDFKVSQKNLKFMLHPNCYKKVHSNEIQFEPAF
jgi:RNA-directed DNA polymerase